MNGYEDIDKCTSSMQRLVAVARAPRAGCYGRQDRGSGPRPVRADSVPQVELLIRQSRRRCYGIMRGYQTQTICTKLGLVIPIGNIAEHSYELNMTKQLG